MKMSIGRWIAMKTQEFGWVAGPITEMTDAKIVIRVKRRQINHPNPSFKSLEGWECTNEFPLAYFKDSKNLPRIVTMPIMDRGMSVTKKIYKVKGKIFTNLKDLAEFCGVCEETVGTWVRKRKTKSGDVIRVETSPRGEKYPQTIVITGA